MKIMKGAPLPKDDITAEYLRSVMSYDPELGVFRWRDTFAAGVCCARLQKPYPRPGDIVRGVVPKIGYRYISIMGKAYLEHRLVWLHVHGEWSEGMIDHIDRDPLNNRLANLRKATPSESICNQRLRADDTSGVRGVHWSKQRQKWRAVVQVSGKAIDAGFFNDKVEAIKARDNLAQKLHGDFVTLNS